MCSLPRQVYDEATSSTSYDNVVEHTELPRQGSMSYSSELSRSQEYLSFRSSVPLRKIVVDADGAKGWKVYDSNPKTIKCPLICLPPVCGTADIFFRQILGLAAKGYRVISLIQEVHLYRLSHQYIGV